MQVTLRDISKASGCSLPTISHILNNKGDLYSSRTREKVLKTARDLGYMPNAAARSMAKRKFECISLLLSTDKNRSYLPGAILDGILDGLDRINHHMTIMKLPDEQLCDAISLPKALRELMSDGLLINYISSIPPKLIEMIEENIIPSIWLNTDRKDDCVRPDDYQAAGDATQYLLRLGHRRIAYASYSMRRGSVIDAPEHYSARDRYLGYAHAMEKAGLQPRLIAPEEHLPRKERQAYSCAWLSGLDRPTAVIAYASTTVVPILCAAQGMGLSVPRKLSLVTFAAEKPFDDIGLDVGSLVVSEYQLGLEAVNMLRRKIERPNEKQALVRIPFVFHPCGTCAAPQELSEK